MIGKGRLIDERIRETIEEYKANIIKNCGSIHPKQLEFAEKLIKEFYEYDGKQIYVNSNRCGMGKSTLLKAFLNNLVNTYCCGDIPREDMLSEYGAIIIHDSLVGLESIANYDGLQDRCYFIGHNDDMMKSDSRIDFKRQLKEQYKYPIILVTTQKYFRMSKNERNILYKWEKGRRHIKIIDEKPYIIQQTTIDQEYLSKIGVALERLHKTEEKRYIITCWRYIEEKLFKLKEMYSKYEIMWIKKNEQPLLLTFDEDKKFFELLANTAEISSKLYNDIETISRIYSEGCLFQSSNKKEQDNTRKFILLEDNSSKFDVDECRCFILDATSKFDMDYRICETLFKVPYAFDDTKEERDIKVMYIPISTSQKTLKANEKVINAICSWINNRVGDKMFIATCQGKQKPPKKSIFEVFNEKITVNKEISYFGNIKGKNDWESYTRMAHIGFNRKSTDVYLQKYIILNGMNYIWNKKEDGDIHAEIQDLIQCENGLPVNEFMKKIMVGDIIADTVQNVMRIKCRHFNNKVICHIYIICSESYYEIVSKVCDAIGGGIPLKYVPQEITSYKTEARKPNNGKKKTNPQIVKEYIETLSKGTIIKMNDVIIGTELSRNQIKTAIKSNLWCSNWFDQHKDGNKNRYIA